ncbi:MAG: transglycosylase SLT domain-containing protein [Thermodesulfobacteriota bacterium]|nr:transglycosylase SLT domain-containing protein [Thermodesulfobacteriota bacterium]
MRVSESIAPAPLPQPQQALFQPPAEEFDINLLETLWSAPDPSIPDQFTFPIPIEDEVVAAIDPGWWDDLALNLAKESAPVLDQDQSSTSSLDLNIKTATKEENPPPPAEKNVVSPGMKIAKAVKVPNPGFKQELAPSAEKLNEGSQNDSWEAPPQTPILLFQREELLSSQSFSPAEAESETPDINQNSFSPIFPSLFNDKVNEFVSFFQNKAGTFFSKALARSLAYEDMMKKIFREKNLPEELFYLALIESGYNPHALSRAKAGGIWQFINKTAKRFGLKVDKWVDERRDPEKATYAAAEYLKTLYEMFNCWDLAMASYNAGEGKVSRAMKKAKSQDFWEISQHRYLKQETKRYVPLFLAAVTIAREPHKYGFSNISYHPPLLYEKVLVPPATNLAWIAKAADTNLAEVLALNPALKRGMTPPDSSQFEIKLPPGKKAVFEKTLLSRGESAAPKGQKHRVKPGETLASIAKRYRVTLKDLCEVNSLSPQTKIKPGITLLLPQ